MFLHIRIFGYKLHFYFSFNAEKISYKSTLPKVSTHKEEYW